MTRTILAVASIVSALAVVSPAEAGTPGPTMGDNWSGLAAIVVVGVAFLILSQVRAKRKS